MKTGILALQGDFQKHADMLSKAGGSPILLRDPRDIPLINSLIIPGGESTTMGKLLNAFGLSEPLKTRIIDGMPVFGTCAGMILLAQDLKRYDQFSFQVLDIQVERNSYGRQIESFETDIYVKTPLDKNVRGVFIRAPRVLHIGDGVEVLAEYEDDPVLLRQGNILAGSFHPELTRDDSIHRFFLEIISDAQ